MVSRLTNMNKHHAGNLVALFKAGRFLFRGNGGRRPQKRKIHPRVFPVHSASYRPRPVVVGVVLSFRHSYHTVLIFFLYF